MSAYSESPMSARTAETRRARFSRPASLDISTPSTGTPYREPKPGTNLWMDHSFGLRASVMPKRTETYLVAQLGE